MLFSCSRRMGRQPAERGSSLTPLVFMLVFGVACDANDPADTHDAGTHDAGTHDAGTHDAGTHDAVTYRCADFVSEYCDEDAEIYPCDVEFFEREDCYLSLWESICREENREPMGDPAPCIDDMRDRTCERFADDPTTFWSHVPVSCDPVFGAPPRP